MNNEMRRRENTHKTEFDMLWHLNVLIFWHNSFHSIHWLLLYFDIECEFTGDYKFEQKM